MGHAVQLDRQTDAASPGAYRAEQISPELAVTMFQLFSGLAGGAAALLAANRLANVDSTIEPGQLALPVALSAAGTLAGAVTLPGEFSLPNPRQSRMRATETFRQRASIDRNCEACKQRSRRISAHSQRFREAGRGVETQQVTDSPIVLKDGNLFLSEVNVPDTAVAPNSEGGLVDVGWGVANGAELVENTDPDQCANSANPCAGGSGDPSYCYLLEVIPSWLSADQIFIGPWCIENTDIIGATEQAGSTEDDDPAPIPAPTIDGTRQEETIQFRLTAEGSGEFGSVQYPVVFEDGANPRPGTGSREVDVDTTGGGGGNGGGDIGQFSTLVALLIILVVALGITTN